MGYHVRLAATYVALFAILLHGLIPAGWMPGGGAGLPITICSADGHVHLLPGQNGPGHKQTPGDQHHHDVCPFAAAPHVSTPVAGMTVVALRQDAIFVAASTYRTVRLARAPYSLQPPRAPPQIATA